MFTCLCGGCPECLKAQDIHSRRNRIKKELQEACDHIAKTDGHDIPYAYEECIKHFEEKYPDDNIRFFFEERSKEIELVIERL